MEYLKLGLLTYFTNICKSLAIQLIFLRVGEIHLNKNVCTAVSWAELCPAGISGTSLLWSQDSVCDQRSDSWFLSFHASAPYCYFYLHHLCLKTDWPFSEVSEHENVWTAPGLCSFSHFQWYSSLWHFGFVLMAYSFLPAILSLWEHGQLLGSISEGLEEDLWTRESWTLSTSDRPLCEWEILLPQHPVALKPVTLGLHIVWQEKGTSS